MYKEMKTNAELEAQGFWIEYYRDDGENDFRVRVARLTTTHPRYAKVIDQGVQRRGRRNGPGLGMAAMQQLQRRAFLGVVEEIVTGWQRWLDGEWRDGIEAEDGVSTIPFTPENVRRTLEQLPELCDELHNEAMASGNFRQERLEHDAGN